MRADVRDRLDKLEAVAGPFNGGVALQHADGTIEIAGARYPSIDDVPGDGAYLLVPAPMFTSTWAAMVQAHADAQRAAGMLL